MPKVKDLNKYLTDKTGLDAEQRELWRNDIRNLTAAGKKEEAFKCFQSFSYWKENYFKKLKKKA